MKIEIPSNVNRIIETLWKNGFEAYAVGGCVRDAVLFRHPNDWDITTSALPTDVKRIFKKTIDTGIIHGTVTVMINHEGFEVTTYRIDGEYEDGRHPKEVSYTRNLVEDLKRRDFTINAMAYNNIVGLVDEFDGMGDIKRKVIRCVGSPKNRFNEDALRILRAVRFAATLGFEIETDTKEAIVMLAENLDKISKERIQVELDKLLLSDHTNQLKSAYETGILKVILPDIHNKMSLGQLEKIIETVECVEKDHYLRWTAFLSTCTWKEAKKILKGLKFDNNTINIVSKIIEACSRNLETNYAGIRRMIYEIGEDIYPLYIKYLIEISKGEQKKKIKEVQNKYNKIIENQECISLKMLAVNGKDLIELGVPRGNEIGRALEDLLYKVLDDQKLNNRETLLNIFKNTHS